jgi:hypothetical protein
LRRIQALNTIGKDYKGVRGWLLFLCLSMAILSPMTGLVSLMAVTNGLKPYFDQDPALFNLVLIEGICNICLFVYSMYAGFSLWRVAPNAVTSTKRYLVVLFHYSFFSIFFPQLVGLSEKTLAEIYKANPIYNVMVMLEAFVWYLYMRRSKRVKATYGEDGPAVS